MIHLIRFNALLILASAILFMSGCKPKNTDKGTETDTADVFTTAKAVFQPLPKQADNPDNPVTPEKVALGKMLYYDTKLSNKGNNSCNSCHNLAAFGADKTAFSVGDDGENGGRNSPTTLNAALHIAQFWDGRAKDVEEQAGMPIMNPVEMHMGSETEVVNRLSKEDTYKKMFAAAFPNEKNAVTFLNMKKAIGAFERTLITPSKFDDYLNGTKDALTSEEQAGLNTFIKSGCTTCHSGAVVGGQMFQKFGLFGNYWDLTKSAKVDSGKILITKNDADLYVFKVPSLRNIAKTAPYFHDGSVSTLYDAIAIMGKAQLNKTLTDDEIKSIAVFLNSLTGTVPADAQVNPFAVK